MPIRVAIVGSGPSGFYTAEALAKSDADCEIDLIERLPAPHGLIRYGVAPDHQTTKNVARNFDKTAARDEMRFYGNVDIGTDISLDDLRGMYDAVVLAIGSPEDNKLGIPGEDKQGVIGSAAFVGWYNGHPDFVDLAPDLNSANVCVIGNGNVAVDIARLLVKTRAELSTSDITNDALDALQASSVTDVYMLGRRGPVEAKFTNVELREMGHLENCVPQIDGSIIPDGVPEEEEMSDRDRRLREKNLGTLRDFVGRDPNELEKRVHFEFYAAPREILGDDKVEGLRLERTQVVDGRAVGTGEFFEIETSLVLPAVGYRSSGLEGLPFNDDWGVAVSEDGRAGDGLYVVGWIKRGPSGVIGTNRPDGQLAAKQIIEDIAEGSKPGRAALEAALQKNGARIVNYDDWQALDAHEKANARDGAPREKEITVAAMLGVLDGA
ncbi:MAG: FAD-dependent oxidoreductase [Rhodospirillaceae bacterium]|jgi:adrenodoxin-NADP+ reductase|nr:FAD-dependent oxidoreductase [Rhodospirillaceae bacterium]MBT4044487.1 FAD-dependent oxidoreductase [Rhodospirillaceae bacterium]MBT4686731.1 FAD-dependent oxidoreductase [Rhodospirillaceae bacterium]MBT5082482.1 FAD-dependent oxidoreductase [Rhodospirillaceae bacterium]MBT5523981.1 FAD-dependent oxidoreductase [Rhodospirillaceae bacterium]